MSKEKVITKLIMEYQEKIYATCLNYSGNHDDAKDIFQEISLIIWQKFDSFRNESSIGTWIYRISVNTCLLFIRRQRKTEMVPFEILANRAVDVSEVEMKHTEENQLNYIYDQIELLSDFDRLLIIMHLDGLKYEEISDITGISTTNVGARLSRIKTKIRINKKQIN